jgi:hypothetical protein
MKNDFWILDEDNRVIAVDFSTWGEWFEENLDKRRVAQDYIEGKNKTIHVSTVFFGLDCRFYGNGPPLLFETMCFGPFDMDQEMRRYSTWGKAVEGHNQFCDLVRMELEIE